MLDLNSILVFSEDPGRLADFYKKVLQKGVDKDVRGLTVLRKSDVD